MTAGAVEQQLVEGDGYTLLRGNCFEALREYDAGTFASVVCDPPHSIGKIPEPSVWAELFRTAAPGAFLLAFGHPRTWHRLACSIEDGGWVYFDTLGQVTDGSPVVHHHLRRGWRPLVLACKGLEVARCPSSTLAPFTLEELVKLLTPPGGCVLDPFMGSGAATGLAALAEGFTFVGVERDPAAFEIACKRLAGVKWWLWIPKSWPSSCMRFSCNA